MSPFLYQLTASHTPGCLILPPSLFQPVPRSLHHPLEPSKLEIVHGLPNQSCDLMDCSRKFFDKFDGRRVRKSTPVLVAEDSQSSSRAKKNNCVHIQPHAENHVLH